MTARCGQRRRPVSDPAATAQRQAARPQGVIATLVTLPLRLFGMLCASLLMAILIECVGMHVVWPQQSWHHAEAMLDYELTHLSSYFTRSLLLEAPDRCARHLVAKVHDTLFVKSGVLDWARAPSEEVRGTRPDKSFRSYLRLMYQGIEPYVQAACFMCLTFLVRLLVLCLTLPLFVMAAFAGLVDGLARRDIRRFGAGRESGFLHHRAKAIIVPVAVLPWVTYLAMPVSVHPLLILLPSAIVLSVVVNIAAGSFKKYL